MTQRAEASPVPVLAGAPAATAPQTAVEAAPGLLRVKPQRSLWGNAWRQFRRHRMAMIGTAVIAIIVLACFVGSALYPQPIDAQDLANKAHKTNEVNKGQK
jgi:MFS superfamily sulfate permease-like transporter